MSDDSANGSSGPWPTRLPPQPRRQQPAPQPRPHRIIGALLQDVSNSFSASLLRSLEDAARDRQCVVLASSLDEEPDRERALVEDLVGRRVDGLILMPATRTRTTSPGAAGRPPDGLRRPPAARVDADRVLVDNRRGAKEAVEHLLGCRAQPGRRARRPVPIPTAAARLRGYDWRSGRRPQARPGARRHGAADDRGGPGRAHGDDRPSRPADGVFACRNILSIGAIRALSELGLSHEVALVGFDDFPLADLIDPPLTVIRQNVREIGARPPSCCSRASTATPHRRADRADPDAGRSRLGRDPPPGRR